MGKLVRNWHFVLGSQLTIENLQTPFIKMSEKTQMFTAELGFTPEMLDHQSNRTRRFGVAFMLLGLAAIVLPGFFTIGFQFLLGSLLLIGGVVQILNALSFSKNKGAAFPMLAGCFTTLLGLVFLAYPLMSAAALTALLAVLLLTSGLLRILHGIQLQTLPGTTGSILSGIFAVTIAVLVWLAWPTSAEWFIGILIGADFILLGSFLIRFAKATKREIDL